MLTSACPLSRTRNLNSMMMLFAGEGWGEGAVSEQVNHITIDASNTAAYHNSAGTVTADDVDGAKAAEADFGVQCRLIADVYRQDPVPMAKQMVEEVIANRRDELLGLGMDAGHQDTQQQEGRVPHRGRGRRR